MTDKQFDKLLVFPAGAGVILSGEVKEIAEFGFPRRCGGDPEFSLGKLKV